MTKIVLGGLVLSSFLALACSSGGSGGSGGSAGNNGGNGGTAGSGNNGGSAGSGNNGGGGSGTDCEATFSVGVPSTDCTDCLVGECCDELTACDANAGCVACFDGDDMTMCDANNAQANALVDCVNGQACAMACQTPICMSGLALPLAQAECGACLNDNCCNEYTACGADMQCLQCITGQLMDPVVCDANAALTAAGDCREMQCDMVCATEICSSGLVHPVPACGNCLEANCCNQFTTCAADMTCLSCITGETDPMSATCTGNANFTAASMCQTTSCANDC